MRHLPWISTVAALAALIGVALALGATDGYVHDYRLEHGGLGALIGGVSGAVSAVATRRSRPARRWRWACLATPSRSPVTEVARAAAVAGLATLVMGLAILARGTAREEPAEVPCWCRPESRWPLAQWP